MDKITFELSWNDLYDALSNHVKNEANLALDIKENEVTQIYIGFNMKEGTSIVDTASVVVKAIRR